MKRHLFIFFLLIISIQLQAQLVKDVWTFGGKANQFEGGTFVDKVGNVFQTVTFDSTFTIDSLGSQILINNNPFGIQKKYSTVAIIKFDSLGVYQFHLIIKGLFVYKPYLNFLSNNEIILTYNFRHKDTIDLYNSDKTLYKKIIPTFRRNQKDGWYQNAHLICKISQSGQYIWETLFNRTQVNSDDSIIGAESLSQPTFITKENDILSFYPFTVNGQFDTLIVTDKIGNKDTAIVTTPTLFVKLNKDGDYLNTYEPIKNKLKYKCPNGGNYTYQIIPIKNGNVQLITIFTSIQDTFNNSTPLSPGKNFLLIKTNNFDSILWVKPIEWGDPSLSGYGATMCYDYHKEEIIISATYRAFVGWRKLLINPSFQSYYDGNYLCRLNLNGDNVWEDFYRDAYFIGFTSSPKSKNIFAYGYSSGMNNSLQKHLLYNPNRIGQPFICYFDSSNQVVSAQPIVSNLNTLVSPKNNNLTSISFSGFSAQDVDNKGANYLSCRFYDSLSIPCNTYRATIESNSFGTPTFDAFVIMSMPLTPSYTTVCKGKLSPSGRHYWSNTGYYFDTLTNSQGCDSILYFYVDILKSNSTLDSTVCVNMRSYSGKYLWDSSGTYHDTIPNVFNCDSFITVNLHVLPKFYNIDTTVKVSFNSPSGKYVWDTSGIYLDTLTNSYGCDSILRIHLKVLQSYGKIDTSVCKEYLSPSGKYTFNSYGLYNDTIPNASGADSILSIHVKILQSFSSIDTTYCSSILSLSTKHLYSQSGNYTDTLINHLGCDSIVSIQFTRTLTHDTIYVSSCPPYFGSSGKLIINQTGLYLDSLVTQKGCDSLIYIYYNNLNSNSIIQIKACDSLISPSRKFTYTQTGTYLDTIQNQYNCDSIIQIQLSIEPIILSITKSNNITCDSPYTQLEVQGASTYNWLPISFLSNPSIYNPTANPDKAIWYYVLAQTDIGCSATDSIEILVNIDIPEPLPTNTFSPNTDGINDCFFIGSIAEFKEVEILIYNRWGNLVFESNDPKSCWDGTNKNGEQLSSGTYYYILNGSSICNTPTNLRGTITLIR